MRRREAAIENSRPKAAGSETVDAGRLVINKMIPGNTDKYMKSLDWSPLSQRRSKINQMIHYFEISDLRENQKLPFQPNKMMTQLDLIKNMNTLRDHKYFKILRLLNMKDLEVLRDKAADMTEWQDLVEMNGDVTTDVEESDDSSTEAELD